MVLYPGSLHWHSLTVKVTVTLTPPGPQAGRTASLDATTRRDSEHASEFRKLGQGPRARAGPPAARLSGSDFSGWLCRRLCVDSEDMS